MTGLLRFTACCATISGLLASNTVYAQSDSFINLIEPSAKNELWLNPGMVTYHFQTDQNLNGGNWGAGAEYRFSSVSSLTAGRFYNSNNAYSNYAGIYYHGGWFPAAIPALTWEGDWVGANVFIIPTIGDRVHGGISLQLKFKVFS